MASRSRAALQRRYSTNSTCSLETVDLALYGFDVCQMTSRHVKKWPIEANSGLDENLLGSTTSLVLRRVPITFGESDCALTLTGCNPGTCYTIFDLSSRGTSRRMQNLPLDEFSELMPRADGTIAPPSIFSSFDVEGADVKWTRAGASFTPTSSSVTIKYSTHSVRLSLAQLRGPGIWARASTCSRPSNVPVFHAVRSAHRSTQ